MKKILITFFICAFFLGNKSYAQEGVRFGITANPSVIWLKPDNQNITNDGARFGFSFGLVVDYVFGNQDRYAFNTGVNMFVAGGKVEGTAEDGSKSFLTAKTNYIEIPLTMKLRSNEIGYLTYYGQLGFVPQIAVRKRANIRVLDSAGVETLSEENIKFENIPTLPNSIEKVVPFNIGLHVEAGLEYSLSENTTLVGGLFFNTGFLDMFKDNDDNRIVSRGMGLRVSVLF